MKPYHTFANVSPSIYEEIKEFIKSKYQIQISDKTLPGLAESFDILNESIKVHYYTKGKLLFQSSPTNQTYADLVSYIDRNFSLKSPEAKQKITEIHYDAKYFVGCDESGAGETFGSIFLGCVAVNVDNLKNIQSILDNPNIKELEEQEILKKYNQIVNYCEIFEIKCKVSEIDETNKNMLLDQKYRELLDKAISGKEKLCVIMDDYGIKRELKSFFNTLESQGNKVIVEIKADEKYAVCQAASVIARKKRLEEVRYINREFSLEDESGRTIYPGTGNAGNPQTAQYLETFLRLNRDQALPSFVRRKWSNVKKLVQEKSNQKMEKFFEDAFVE